MASLLLLGMSACSSTGGAPAATTARATPAPELARFEVTARSLNVRAEPTTEAAVLGSLKQGEHVSADGPAVNGWQRVQGADGLAGYASAKYLRAIESPAQAAAPAPEPASAETTAAQEPAPAESTQGRPAPAGTALARVKLGMSEPEVAAIMGVPTSQSNYQTGKAWIPYYYGSDTSRLDYKYKGVGVVVFGRNRYSGQTKVIRIDYDPNEDGY